MRTQPQQYAILFPSFSFIFCLLFIHYRLFLYQLSVGAWIGIGIALAAAVCLVIVLSVFMYKGPTKVAPSPQPDVPMDHHNEAHDETVNNGQSEDTSRLQRVTSLILNLMRYKKKCFKK